MVTVPMERVLISDMLEFARGIGAGPGCKKGYFFSIDRLKAGRVAGAVSSFTKRVTPQMIDRGFLGFTWTDSENIESRVRHARRCLVSAERFSRQDLS